MSDTPPLHDLLAHRWSPRAFSSRPVPPEILRSLFEAARWSASCFSEQPWRFVIATRDEPGDFARILDTLVPKNQEWARNAWLLGISAGKKAFTHNSAPNRYGLHDAGAALANLAVQATALGLFVHGMGGFDHDKARQLGISDDYDLGAAFAIGYIEGSPEPPPTRTRRPLEELVFRPGWVSSGLVSGKP
ncbi:MAG TPA: nitroreductase family protein [Bryobacteraceae bacterium]|nr:nitroreductase family protein [Bryobacteraceae bacterium]